MAAGYVVQVQRGDEWRNVTSISNTGREAFAEATRQLTGWQSYDGFHGLRLRIAERVGRWGDSYAEARRP